MYCPYGNIINFSHNYATKAPLVGGEDVLVMKMTSLRRVSHVVGEEAMIDRRLSHAEQPRDDNDFSPGITQLGYTSTR